MLESKDIDVNCQNISIADVHPDYKKAFIILQTVFHNSFYNQKNNSFDSIKYNAYKRTAQIIVCKYGIESLEYLEENILENDPRFGDLYAKPSAVLNFVKDNLNLIQEFKEKKQLNNKKTNEKTEVLTENEELVPISILRELIPDIQENSRVIPNVFLRSSLFGILKRGQRNLVKDKEILSLSQYKIYFSGEELDQLDLITWDALVYLFKEKTSHLNTKRDLDINITIYEICKFLGYKNDSKVRKQVYERIKRLTFAHVRIDFNNFQYMGSLIYGFSLDKSKDFYCLSMNKKLINIFSNSKDYTYINVNIRRELGQNQLAIWLYHFFASHDKPIPYKLSFLRELSRSDSEQKEFNRLLKTALEIIKKAYDSEGVKFDFVIQNGELQITKLKNVLKIR